ncbi:uncharacterized protein K460DRAFT_250998, partial [Cucurbitaria berberidis CBS 394.84]
NDATAQTLNYALGNLGGKQKSWMVEPLDNAPVPVEAPTPTRTPPGPIRRRGRPPKHPAPWPPMPNLPKKKAKPQAARTARPTQDPPTEPQACSNSNSPQLANTLTRRDSTNHGPSAITVFPSPPPSVENWDPAAPAQTTRQGENAVPFGPPRTLFRGTTQHPFSEPAHVGHAPVPQSAQSPQQLAAPPNFSSALHNSLPVLSAQLTSRIHSTHHHPDRRRLMALKDALADRDWAYLTMHQYYCLLTFNQGVVPHQVLTHPSLRTACDMMKTILQANETLTNAVLGFLCDFPYSLLDMADKWPSDFQHHGELFLSFITHSPNWDRLNIICQNRKCPPLARELAVDIKIASRTFQRLVFLSFVRYTWLRKADDSLRIPCEANVVAIFKKNQDDFYRRASLTANVQASNLQINQQEKESELRMFGSQFKQVIAGLELSLPQGQNRFARAAPSNQMAPRSGRPVNPHGPQTTQQASGPGRSRTQNVPGSHIQSVQLPRRRPLLPPPGWTQPQQRQPNPGRFSLHQAHLRSPVLQARLVPSPLYHFAVGFIQPPTRLVHAGRAIERCSFTRTRDAMQHIAKTVPGALGEPDTRSVCEGSQTVRLRCIKWPAGAELPNEHAWAVADTAWVPNSHITFNGKYLQQRKKIHHGKDLPIVITGLLKEGVNKLEIAVLAQSHDLSPQNYLFAIEILSFKSHDAIKQHCLTNRPVPAEQILEGIKKKLHGTNNDEISILDSNTTINLFDPFSASRMCDIPVRSVACLHNDCFDLETFLQTRQRKNDTSVPDQWRCPICNADARPHYLFVDGFIEHVHKQLKAQGLLRTRAIIVQQNGTWKPKPEVCDPNGVSDRGASEENPTPTRAQFSIPAHVDVIDLCD